MYLEAPTLAILLSNSRSGFPISRLSFIFLPRKITSSMRDCLILSSLKNTTQYLFPSQYKSLWDLFKFSQKIVYWNLGNLDTLADNKIKLGWRLWYWNFFLQGTVYAARFDNINLFLDCIVNRKCKIRNLIDSEHTRRAWQTAL